MIDIHNHVLINVDDGPATREEAIALVRQAKDDGISGIIATPHHKNAYFNTPKTVVMDNLKELLTVLEEEKLNIRIYPGQEIRINGDILKDLKSGESLTLNNTQYVLVEFSFIEYPSYSEKIFFDMQMKGYVPIIAHPERYEYFRKSPDKLFNLIEKGAYAQITASSVTGELGIRLKKYSLKMIENNLIHLVASDAHEAVTRPFAMKEAYEIITSELGKEYTDQLKINAQKVLNGMDLISNPPIMIDSFREKNKKRFFGLF